jgi:GNAT superfamily N-acetyltransferase
VIGPASEADLDAVVELLRDCVADMRAHGIDQWDEVYPDRAKLQADIHDGALYVARDEHGIAAAMALNAHQDPEYADVAWRVDAPPFAVVHRLMVHPRVQRRGLGRSMMAFAERRARELGYRAMRLDTFAGNPRALALYTGLGYREAGTVRFRKGLFRCFEKSLVSLSD